MAVHRISVDQKYLILGFAILVDIIEIILLFTAVGTIFEVLSGIIQYGIVWVLFAMNGVPFFSSRRIKRQVFAGVLESVPAVGALPIFTWSVWKTIKEAEAEDEEQNQQADNETITRQSATAAAAAQNSEQKTGNITRLRRNS